MNRVRENDAPRFAIDALAWLTNAKIAALSPAEEGALLRLLCYAWAAQEEGIPAADEELAILSRLGENWYKNGCGERVRSFFTRRGDRLYHPSVAEPPLAKLGEKEEGETETSAREAAVADCAGDAPVMGKPSLDASGRFQGVEASAASGEGNGGGAQARARPGEIAKKDARNGEEAAPLCSALPGETPDLPFPEKPAFMRTRDEQLRRHARFLAHRLIATIPHKPVTSPRISAEWIYKLLRKGVPPEQVHRVIQWLSGPNRLSDYPFVVESGHALYQKWDRICAVMARAKQPENKQPLSAEVIYERALNFIVSEALKRPPDERLSYLRSCEDKFRDVPVLYGKPVWERAKEWLKNQRQL